MPIRLRACNFKGQKWLQEGVNHLRVQPTGLMQEVSQRLFDHALLAPERLAQVFLACADRPTPLRPNALDRQGTHTAFVHHHTWSDLLLNKRCHSNWTPFQIQAGDGHWRLHTRANISLNAAVFPAENPLHSLLQTLTGDGHRILQI